MLTSDFDFELPRACIAQQPANPRDSSRLLTVGKELEDHRFFELPRLLKPGDCLVLNDTKVIPAKLSGTRGTAKIEITLHLRHSDQTWDAFARPARKLKKGDRIQFGNDFYADVLEKKSGGEVTLGFDGLDTDTGIEKYGIMPLPPYIKRGDEDTSSDEKNYQTIYAANPGAVAAPTAGLHYTSQLFENLEQAGIFIEKLTLHVGAGTFLPVKSDKVEEHVMHSEWGMIDAPTADHLNQIRSRGGRIVAAGTTVLRLLESAATESGRIKPFKGTTDIFITPGYRFRGVDILQTNFHLPRSTLFMLVAAFSGLERMRAAYLHAINNDYRFYSYGDACLLECFSS